MKIKDLIHKWFDKWEQGDFLSLPVSDDFTHTSPFGEITGKDAYLKLVEKNQDKFLGYHFIIHDEIYGEHHACVRYTAIQSECKLDVSEWYYIKDHLIDKIISYYHIGEIREERKLS